MFQKCEYVYKTACLHKSSYTPAKISREKTINMAFVSSHIDLQNCVSDFWRLRYFVIFLLQDKVRKEKK